MDDSYFVAVATDQAGIWIGFPSVQGNVVYRSTDNAKSFQKVTLPFSFLAVDVAFGNGVFIAFGADLDINNMIRSTDYGLTWSTAATPWPGVAVAYGAGVFAAPWARTTRGIYTTNKGVSWSTQTGSTNGSGDAYAAATFTGSKFVFAGVNLLKTSVDGKALVDAPNQTRPIIRLRSIGGHAYALKNTTQASFTVDPELSTSSEVSVDIAPFDLDYAFGRLFVGGATSYLAARKERETAFIPVPNLSNNLGESASRISVRRIYSDGAGVLLVFGTYGLLMRGELR